MRSLQGAERGVRCGKYPRHAQRRVGIQGHLHAGFRRFLNLESGATVDEMIEWFAVTREQVTAFLEFAARHLDGPALPCWSPDPVGGRCAFCLTTPAARFNLLVTTDKRMRHQQSFFVGKPSLRGRAFPEASCRSGQGRSIEGFTLRAFAHAGRRLPVPHYRQAAAKQRLLAKNGNT